MHGRLGPCLVFALLAGCASAPNQAPSAAAGPAAGTTQTTAAQPAPGSPLLEIIGTPFLIALKIPVCVLTIVVAAPVAGLSELSGSGDEDGRDMRRQLGNGIDRNCGPPYVVSP